MSIHEVKRLLNQTDGNWAFIPGYGYFHRTEGGWQLSHKPTMDLMDIPDDSPLARHAVRIWNEAFSRPDEQ